jgi:hypothetical protein
MMNEPLPLAIPVFNGGAFTMRRAGYYAGHGWSRYVSIEVAVDNELK